MIDDRLFKQFSDLFYTKTGIKLKDEKKYLLVNRLSKYIGSGRIASNYEDYYKKLVSGKDPEMMITFVNALTTNYSFFFRENIHFEFLKWYLNHIDGKETDLRIWSAACSSGEEPYSISISCNEHLSTINSSGLKILGTDISTRVLDLAKQGTYSYEKNKEILDKNIIRKYFTVDDTNNTITVKDNIKKFVHLKSLNLLGNYPFKFKFNVVFLRNVLIYFNSEEKELILNKIYKVIKNGGYLVLGHAESLIGLNTPYKQLKYSVYKKIESKDKEWH